MLILFESITGYSLFSFKEEFALSLIRGDFQNRINNYEIFFQNFKLNAFAPFRSINHALKESCRICTSLASEYLQKFILNSCYLGEDNLELGVTDARLAIDINKTIKKKVITNDEILELSRKFNVEQFLSRDVNVDLSGGEKKRSELFQLAIKKPKVALLDEIDSGLDIDAIKSVSGLINENRNKDTSYILVTHYSRILKYLNVDQVHIVVQGNVIKSGGEELIEEVDSNGYTQYQE